MIGCKGTDALGCLSIPLGQKLRAPRPRPTYHVMSTPAERAAHGLSIGARHAPVRRRAGAWRRREVVVFLTAAASCQAFSTRLHEADHFAQPRGSIGSSGADRYNPARLPLRTTRLRYRYPAHPSSRSTTFRSPLSSSPRPSNSPSSPSSPSCIDGEEAWPSTLAALRGSQPQSPS